MVFGMNAIAAYFFAEVVAHCLSRIHIGNGIFTLQEWIYQQFFADLASPRNSSLLYGLVYLFMCWFAMWLLYRKKVFLKI